ncbi:putative aminopeptidase [Bernardetia litoralis DSM 6794]|uniref:Carboxypeptidase Q n=1 Tax=Bernardetia litoralis (strain ATCC 23117 / DSM 6794 / NBRC 15988 / NCIMB 1366 / Fx l1 / Sio-4) TaxID=880071 RepID=I4AK55_BERLS|nr:M28 family peptidase [Bernardetia litoralis]AFM04340.1 putative aminopeptidase [Bernardetia litoralis DSM 6794]
MKKNILSFLILVLCSGFFLFSCTSAEAPPNYTQDNNIKTEIPEPEIVLRSIHDDALVGSPAYAQLRYLCKDIGARLSGSENAQKAVEYMHRVLDSMNLDTVYLQPVMVPHWERGEKEFCQILGNNSDKIEQKILDITALGGSVGTNGGLKSEIVAVNSLSDLENLSKKEAKKYEGKIIFVTQPMDAKFINTGSAYGACSSVRVRGANYASKVGAKAFLIRSLTLKNDNHPHTGIMIYQEGGKKIPAAALSTNSANYLEKILTKAQKENKSIEMELQLNCEILPDVLSYNVIGELRGREKPEEIITVGGHLDSWDLGEGAHDDGTGCLQSVEVLRLIQKLENKPKRTIRCVLFMSEENGASGAKEYARVAKEKNENHIAALESDSGGFTPRGFRVQDSTRLKIIQKWQSLFEPYNLHKIEYGFSGVDIRPLEDSGTLLIGLEPDSQRYFDVHHAETDVFENVHEREFLLGAAAMASLTYMMAEYGIE